MPCRDVARVQTSVGCTSRPRAAPLFTFPFSLPPSLPFFLSLAPACPSRFLPPSLSAPRPAPCAYGSFCPLARLARAPAWAGAPSEQHFRGMRSRSALQPMTSRARADVPPPQPQSQLSYLGGAGVEGGQGSNDYNYGGSLCARVPPARCFAPVCALRQPVRVSRHLMPTRRDCSARRRLVRLLHAPRDALGPRR